MPKNAPNLNDTPDALSPEWAAYESAWAIDVADFGDPLAASQFLIRRKRIFRAAQAAGISKDMLTPFAPNKPGFEARVKEAFLSVAGVAAE
ncbi:hypothetical protein [Roseinatronobacter monicus]|uniref:hypothetical protein n=1 Tax=Roseinatronobacter monicus TaxID=393481 RepID=UPI003F3FCC8E